MREEDDSGDDEEDKEELRFLALRLRAPKDGVSGYVGYSISYVFHRI